MQDLLQTLFSEPCNRSEGAIATVFAARNVLKTVSETVFSETVCQKPFRNRLAKLDAMQQLWKKLLPKLFTERYNRSETVSATVFAARNVVKTVPETVFSDAACQKPCFRHCF